MRKYIYKKVDAFTKGKSLGNPAAYLNIGEDQLTQEEMLRIGKEHAGFVSEIVFCNNSKMADVKLTYYSSECEVDFCGHGTIATMYDLIKSNVNLYNKKEILLETNRKGNLVIYNQLREENAIYITAPSPQFLELPVTKEKTAIALGLQLEDLSEEYSLDFIDAGLKTLIVPLKKLQKEISIYPDKADLETFCKENGIDIILIFSMETQYETSIAHTRVFAPKFGYLEDPATGSGNSAFGNYLLHNQLWDGQATAVEQGGDDRVFNIVRLSTKDGNVLFGGKATTRIAGEYYLE